MLRKENGWNWLVRCCPFIVMLLSVPQWAGAESLRLVRTATLATPEAVTMTPKHRQPVSVGLDDHGDVTVYFPKLAVTMTYNPVDVAPPPRDHVVPTVDPQTDTVGGFGVKVCFAF